MASKERHVLLGIKTIIDGKGKSLIVECPLFGTVLDLKDRIHAKTGVLVCHQRIIVMGFEIPNCVEIKELNVGNLEIIHMVCLPKPATVRIKIYNINSDSIIKLDCSPTTTVGEMKNQIEELFYVESHLQKITLDGMELRDEQSIDLFNLKKVLFVLEF